MVPWVRSLPVVKQSHGRYNKGLVLVESVWHARSFKIVDYLYAWHSADPICRNDSEQLDAQRKC